MPYGALPYTPEFWFTGLHELKSWEGVEHNGKRVTAVPVQHFSGRYGIDGSWMRDVGYTGYVVQYNGDTGYDPEMFKEIGEQRVVFRDRPLPAGGEQ